jgi:hypothetical protein
VTNWATGQTRDLSGNGNTGSLVDMSTSTAPTAGKIGQALSLNGISRRIRLHDIWNHFYLDKKRDKCDNHYIF